MRILKTLVIGEGESTASLVVCVCAARATLYVFAKRFRSNRNVVSIASEAFSGTWLARGS
eukprot:1194289-Prorocentrum_minimum.AAC.2